MSPLPRTQYGKPCDGALDRQMAAVSGEQRVKRSGVRHEGKAHQKANETIISRATAPEAYPKAAKNHECEGPFRKDGQHGHGTGAGSDKMCQCEQKIERLPRYPPCWCPETHKIK